MQYYTGSALKLQEVLCSHWKKFIKIKGWNTVLHRWWFQRHLTKWTAGLSCYIFSFNELVLEIEVIRQVNSMALFLPEFVLQVPATQQCNTNKSKVSVKKATIFSSSFIQCLPRKFPTMQKNLPIAEVVSLIWTQYANIVGITEKTHRQKERITNCFCF